MVNVTLCEECEIREATATGVCEQCEQKRSFTPI